MKMIIGGAYQGKLAYAKKQNPYIHWTDGELCKEIIFLRQKESFILKNISRA